MSVTLDDLRPKEFNITVKGVELTSKPLRLSHALIVAKLGKVFESPDNASTEQIKQAQADIDGLIGELIPELEGVELDMSSTMELVTQLMNHVQPSDNKELQDKGVSMDTDPKV